MIKLQPGDEVLVECEAEQGTRLIDPRAWYRRDDPDTPRYDEIDDLRGASTSRESITLDTSSQRITARHDAESQPGMRRGVVERVDDRAPETNTVSAFEWAY